MCLSVQYQKKKKSYCQLTLESFKFSMPVFALYKCLLGLIGSVMSPITRIFIALLRNYRTYQPTVNSLSTQVLPNHPTYRSDLSTSYQLVVPTHLIVGIKVYQILCLNAGSIAWESTYLNIHFIIPVLTCNRFNAVFSANIYCFCK